MSAGAGVGRYSRMTFNMCVFIVVTVALPDPLTFPCPDSIPRDSGDEGEAGAGGWEGAEGGGRGVFVFQRP